MAGSTGSRRMSRRLMTWVFGNSIMVPREERLEVLLGGLLRMEPDDLPKLGFAAEADGSLEI